MCWTKMLSPYFILHDPLIKQVFSNGLCQQLYEIKNSVSFEVRLGFMTSVYETPIFRTLDALDSYYLPIFCQLAGMYSFDIYIGAVYPPRHFWTSPKPLADY